MPIDDNLDWSGVSPELIPEMRRQIAILDNYVSKPRWTRQGKAGVIAALGVRPSTFRYMVEAWRRSRTPRLLPFATGTHRSGRPRNLPAAVEIIVADVLRDLEPTSKPLILYDEICRRCAAASLKPPSRKSLVERRLAAIDAHRLHDPAGRESREVRVEFCPARLLVGDKGNASFAIFAAAYHEGTGRILSHRLSRSEPTATEISSLIRECLEQWPRARVPEFRLSLRAEDQSLAGLLRNHGALAARKRGQIPAPFGLLGCDLGGVRLLRKTRSQRLPSSRGLPFIPFKHAERIVARAVVKHNKTRPPISAEAPSPTVKLQHVIRDLEAFAGLYR